MGRICLASGTQCSCFPFEVLAGYERIALSQAKIPGNVIPAQAGIQGSSYPGSPLSWGRRAEKPVPFGYGQRKRMVEATAVGSIGAEWFLPRRLLCRLPVVHNPLSEASPEKLHAMLGQRPLHGPELKPRFLAEKLLEAACASEKITELTALEKPISALGPT